MKTKDNFSTKKIKEMANNIITKNNEIKDILLRMSRYSSVIYRDLEGSLSFSWQEAAKSYRRRAELIFDKTNVMDKEITSYITNTVENEQRITNDISNVNDSLNNIYSNIDDIDI